MKAKLQEMIKDAMRARDKETLTTLRLLNDAIQKEEKALLRDLTEGELLKVVEKSVKTYNEELEGFQKAGRTEKVADLQKALKLVSTFLPAQLSEEEVRAIAEQKKSELIASGQEVGMRTLMPLVKKATEGQASGKLVSDVVKSMI